MFCPLLPPLLRPLKYLNPNRVQMNIIMHSRRTLLGIKQDRFVSSLKQRSVPSVTPVEPDPIAGVKPMHRSREARPRPHFHLQMIVVGHQYMGVDLHAKTLRKLPQSLQKILVTTPNPKNHLSLMPTVHHMIPAVRYFQSGMPGHTPPSNQLAVMSNIKMRPFMLYPLKLGAKFSEPLPKGTSRFSPSFRLGPDRSTVGSVLRICA